MSGVNARIRIVKKKKKKKCSDTHCWQGICQVKHLNDDARENARIRMVKKKKKKLLGHALLAEMLPEIVIG